MSPTGKSGRCIHFEALNLNKPLLGIAEGEAVSTCGYVATEADECLVFLLKSAGRLFLDRNVLQNSV
jgi:hypothetical protein